MDTQFWRHILELLLRYPELIIALTWFLGILIAVIGGVAWLVWYLRGLWDRGQLRAQEILVKVSEKQVVDTTQRLEEANQKIALVQQQLQAREADEAIAGTISAIRLSLQNATASNTAAQNLIASFPATIVWTSTKEGGH